MIQETSDHNIVFPHNFKVSYSSSKVHSSIKHFNECYPGVAFIIPTDYACTKSN